MANTKNILGNITLVIVSTLFFFILFEGVMKFVKPYTAFGAGTELRWMKEQKSADKAFVIEEGFGFRPILGNSLYNEFGTHVNDYKIEKDANKKRLLFIGDSVTSRGKIIEALKEKYGTSNYEYWNAGVESFNLVQEVNFYNKFNYKVNPDHVILTFHVNDFSSTPIAFLNKEGRLVVYTPFLPTQKMNPWLYKNSMIYRLYVKIITKSQVNEGLVGEVREKLKGLKQSLETKGIKFNVILLPSLRPYAEWTEVERKSRDSALQIFSELDIEYYDLLKTTNQSIEYGVNINETPGDFWHPSLDVAREYADFLSNNKIIKN